jgi:hypothetical protein
MTLEQAMTKCTWDLLTDEEKAVVNQRIANPNDETLKEKFLEAWRNGMARRVALITDRVIKQISPAYSFQGHADLLIEGVENGVEKCWYYDSVDGTFEDESGLVDDAGFQFLNLAVMAYRAS